MLETIPIYRITLQPESYLPNANPGKALVDLVCELPNHQTIHRKSQMNKLPRSAHANYYMGHLLMEAKHFCREMFYNCRLNAAPYQNFTANMHLEDCFDIIKENRLPFFRYLVAGDLKKYKLYLGNLKGDIQQAESVDEIQKHLKKYAKLRERLYQHVNNDFQKLKRIYC